MEVVRFRLNFLFSVNIQYFNEDVSFPDIDQEKLNKWISFSIQQEGKKTDSISIIFCSDRYLLEINQTYLKHDFFTDIVTFDYVNGNQISGDLFISCDRVQENAADFQVDFFDELHRVIIHGILHLLGYKDKDTAEKERMTSKEDFYLGELTRF